jgi:hypothetical protein
MMRAMCLMPVSLHDCDTKWPTHAPIPSYWVGLKNGLIKPENVTRKASQCSSLTLDLAGLFDPCVD